ncbi:MAG: S9 family peptidase [Myxococcota bacterium]|nr:S9 family peptidase [Myxococcota bacterium]
MKKLALVFIVIAACGGGQKPQPQPEPQPVDVAQPAPPPVVTPPAPEAPVAKGNPSNVLIPRAVLFGNPVRSSVQLSHDGKHISWLAPKDGVMNVWVAPIGKLDEAKAVTSDTVRPIRGYFWAYTNKHIVYGQDAAGDENFHVFRADIADGKTTDITPQKGARASIAGLSWKKPTTLIVSVNDRDAKVFDLHELDLVTAERKLLVQNDDSYIGFTLDNDLKPRFATKKLPDGATHIFIAETKGGKITWKPWQQIPFEDADTTSVDGFTPNNKAVYMTETRGRDTGALVELDLATKKTKVIAEDPKVDVGGAMSHPKNDKLQAVGFNYDKQRWKIIDKAIQRDLDTLAKLEPGAQISVGTRTLDDKTWMVAATTEKLGQRYYLWDRAKQKPTFLFASRPELEKLPLVKMWPVEIKARDGLTLMSYLTLPKAADANEDGKADKPAPMVLLVHGGPWGRDAWGYDPLHQLFANRGYAVLSVNFRASTGFGKKFLHAGNLQWGKAMHDDLLDAVQWAVAQNVTAKDTVCITGGSYGGYATLAGLAMTPDVFRCGVDIVGPSNLLTLLASIPAYWGPMVAMLHTRMGNPETPEGKALLTAASPLTHASKITKPLLIAQGKNDPRVKEAESEQIVAAMKKSNLPVTYVLFPDEGHGFARPENMIAFTAVTEAFLSAHLGGTYLPITLEELKASSMQIKEGKNGIPGLPK